MTSVEKIVAGANKYIAAEIAPLLSVPKLVAVTALAPVLIEANIRRYMGSEVLSGTGLTDGTGVNVDALYPLIKNAASGKWPMEIAGIKFSESDLDKLYNYIKEA